MHCVTVLARQQELGILTSVNIAADVRVGGMDIPQIHFNYSK
jgi:hypothetical protein